MIGYLLKHVTLFCNLSAQRSNSDTVWFNFQTYIYIYIVYFSHIVYVLNLTCIALFYYYNYQKKKIDSNHENNYMDFI